MATNTRLITDLLPFRLCSINFYWVGFNDPNIIRSSVDLQRFNSQDNIFGNFMILYMPHTNQYLNQTDKFSVILQ